MSTSWNKLIAGIGEGHIPSLARLITRVENRAPGWQSVMKEIYLKTGNARVIGITGSPGAGKSTLTGKVATYLSEQGLQVGIIAIDPSSPFSGGALLGDRIRMSNTFRDKNIYIRSMATRGALGGLCQAARDVSRIMDAFGKDIILIETVGVGQDEIEVVKAADMVAVVSVPGQGDGVQALKAGIMEIADIFVVNKADRDGADEVVADISGMLHLSPDISKKIPEIVKTVSTTGEGIAEFVEHINSVSRTDDNLERNEDQIKDELLTLLEREVSSYALKKWGSGEGLNKAINDIVDRVSDPYSVVDEMLAEFKQKM